MITKELLVILTMNSTYVVFVHPFTEPRHSKYTPASSYLLVLYEVRAERERAKRALLRIIRGTDEAGVYIRVSGRSEGVNAQNHKLRHGLPKVGRGVGGGSPPGRRRFPSERSERPERAEIA